MTDRAFSSRIVFTLVFALLLLKTGCDGQVFVNRKCFAWTKAEGACPAQTEAIDFFSLDGTCPPPIQSVDSEGEFLGDRCCYAVTDSIQANPGCVPSLDGGPGTSVGAGGVGGPGPACLSCGTRVTQVFQGKPSFVPPCWISPDSEALWNTVFDCLCTGTCQSACSASICSGLDIPTTECFDCATDAAVGCGKQFGACMDGL